MAQLSRVTKKILAQLSSVLFHRKLLILNLAQLSRELNYPEAQLSRVDCSKVILTFQVSWNHSILCCIFFPDLKMTNLFEIYCILIRLQAKENDPKKSVFWVSCLKNDSRLKSYKRRFVGL